MGDLRIELGPDLESVLDEVCKSSGRTREVVVVEVLRRQLALLLFEQSRSKISSAAAAQGYLTDEDVFRDVS